MLAYIYISIYVDVGSCGSELVVVQRVCESMELARQCHSAVQRKRTKCANISPSYKIMQILRETGKQEIWRLKEFCCETWSTSHVCPLGPLCVGRVQSAECSGGCLYL